MHDTFWSLLRSRGHWEFEIFLMVIFDVMLAGVWRFIVRFKAKPPIVPMKSPQGICEECGGMIRRLIESGIEFCHGCGGFSVLDWSMSQLARDAGHVSVKPADSTDAEMPEKPAKNPDGLTTPS